MKKLKIKSELPELIGLYLVKDQSQRDALSLKKNWRTSLPNLCMCKWIEKYSSYTVGFNPLNDRKLTLYVNRELKWAVDLI